VDVAGVTDCFLEGLGWAGISQLELG